MATTTLTFHPRCGRRVHVTEGGMKVERERTRHLSGFGGALTARPLRTSEMFKIELTGKPMFYFGITTHNPEKLAVVPELMHILPGTWCLAWGNIYVNGKVVNRQFLSQTTLDTLKAGDTIGLMVTRDRRLHYYVNGTDAGIAATDIPNTIYGFVELWAALAPDVKLIPNVQEKVDISTTAPPIPMQEKEKSKSSAVREIAYSDLEFGDTLGRGGQGAVYEGQWKSKRLSVAIKRVLGKIRDEEAEILSKLSHPYVITFYGICTERYPEYFIITELAEWGSLFNLIHEKHYHPNLEESIRWAKEIADGMRYLHQKKVIHRDLKSHNVLLTASRTIKLCDFGSAKEFDHTTLQTGTGTYRWIAPEVLKGEKVSLSCDVFSYGMVLFEIFKQEVPFADIHDIKVANMILEGKTPAIPTTLKPYLANLMKYCWEMNPKARPSFEEVLVILEKKECPEPVSESPEATPDTADGRPAGDVSLTPKDLPHLQTVLEEASGMWYPLGMKLKLDTKTLTGIATASGDDNSTAISFMLTRWLKSKDQPPLLQSLTASLCSPDIGLPHLSDTLMKDKHHYGQ